MRQALGATPARIGRMALLQGVALSIVGIGLGVAAGFFLARALSAMIGASGPGTILAYIVAVIVMAAAVIGATAIPARRARRVDLNSLLRPQ